MATPDPSDTVKDREYTNWLKVTLALYYMKSGLHTFIQSEVDCLHQSLVQKIYAGQPVQLSPCTNCNAGLVRRNNHTGVWKFQTQCKLSCDVWFCKLLALHNNPKSNKIYWANSDISLWPFKPWECAKAFLPRGQQPTNTGPAESDAQALMVLLSNCTHFHPKLSQQGQMLTHKISTIRNQIMHDVEMRVSDADRMSFIQQIIQLLEDPVSLKSLEDCKAAVSNIQKISEDSTSLKSLEDCKEVFDNIHKVHDMLRDSMFICRIFIKSIRDGKAINDNIHKDLYHQFNGMEKLYLTTSTRYMTWYTAIMFICRIFIIKSIRDGKAIFDNIHKNSTNYLRDPSFQ